jgi:FkbM family methyltransferase
MEFIGKVTGTTGALECFAALLAAAFGYALSSSLLIAALAAAFGMTLVFCLRLFRRNVRTNEKLAELENQFAAFKIEADQMSQERHMLSIERMSEVETTARTLAKRADGAEQNLARLTHQIANFEAMTILLDTKVNGLDLQMNQHKIEMERKLDGEVLAPLTHYTSLVAENAEPELTIAQSQAVYAKQLEAFLKRFQNVEEITALLAVRTTQFNVIAGSQNSKSEQRSTAIDQAILRIESREAIELAAQQNQEAFVKEATARLAALEAATSIAQSSVAAQQSEVIALTRKIGGLSTATDDLTKTATLLRSSLTNVTRGENLPFEFYGIDVFEPEIDVLPLLAAAVQVRTAIDVGANRGALTAALRRVGFSVDAFEPLPELAAGLNQRFSGDDKVKIHAVACSNQTGSAQLHTVEAPITADDNTLFSSLEPHPVFSGFEFTGAINVPMTTLNAAMAKDSILKVGLLKIDTEGHDLAVLSGANLIEPEVLLVEFWDREHVFNAGMVGNTLEDYLAAIDQERYPFHLVFWRQSGFDQFGISVGGSDTPAASWGNVMFLSDEKLFKTLINWAGHTYGVHRLDMVTRQREKKRV